MDSNDLDSTGRRRALVEEAHDQGYESAEALYRCVGDLRDLLPRGAQKQLAVAFEWTREGIGRQISGKGSPELAALHAAYTYAPDVLAASATRESDRT